MTAACTLSDVAMTLDSGRCLFAAIDMQFEAGARYVIQGQSGAGKTTLLDVVSQYRAPTRGTVSVTGTTGYLIQGESLFTALTAGDNLAIRPSVRHSADPERVITGLLNQVGLDHREQTPVSVMSGGERQRLQVAGLLADGCDLVLMDEPTSSLDASTRDDVCSLITAVFPAATLVVVSHDPELPALLQADRTLVLREGSLADG